MGSAFRNLRHAVRSLMGDKGFTVTVVLTIAVCIAANTATFAVVNSVLLRPLPVPEARSILLMANRYPKAGADFGYNSASGDYYDRLRDVHVFSEQALFRTNGQTLDIQGTPERVTGMLATPSLFRLLRESRPQGRARRRTEGHSERRPGPALFGSPQAALRRDLTGERYPASLSIRQPEAARPTPTRCKSAWRRKVDGGLPALLRYRKRPAQNWRSRG